MSAPSAPPPAHNDPTGSSSLRRRLTLPHALAIGLGSMVGAGVFSVLGLATLATGGDLWLLLAALGLAGLTAWCNAASTAQLAAVHPTSGGAYTFGRRQLSPTAGFVAGWGFVTGKTASVAAMALTIGLYVMPQQPQAAQLIAVGAVVVVTGVSLLGATRTAQVTLAILIPVLAVLLLVIVAALAAGPQAGTTTPDLAPGGAAGVLQAAGLLFFAFAGYARIATMGEEVVDPVRTIPRAVFGALALTLVLYLLLALALVFALSPQGLAGSDAPVRDALEAVLGPGWGWLAGAAAVVASLGAMLNLAAGISRTGLAMAREGDLPRPMARVSERFSTPWVSQVVVAVAVILLVLFTDVLTVVGFSSFGVLVYYAIANAAAFTLAPADRLVRAPRAVNVLGLVLCLVLAFTLPGDSVLAMVGVFLVGLGARAFVLTGRNRPGGPRGRRG